MSLQTKKKQRSVSKKTKRGKSLEHKQKVSFRKQQNHELSIINILDQTIKSVNQHIMNQSLNYRDSKFSIFEASKTEKTQDNSEIANQNKIENYSWQIQKIEQKRKIKGIKAKLAWNNSKDGNRVVLRAAISDKYIRTNQSDYFVELDTINFDLSVQQQRAIQKSINKVLDEQKQKVQQIKTQIFSWLKAVMLHSHNLFSNMKLNERKKTKENVEIKRSQINPNYMLYPCPASVTWSPHGMLCLSENKVGGISKPVQGNIFSYRHLIQAPYKFERFAKKNNQINDLKMVDQRKQQEQETTQAEFFGWDVKQEINFSIFGRFAQEQPIQQISESNKMIEHHNEKSQKRIVKDHQTFFMGNTMNIAPKIQKIYRRYFVGCGENAQFQFCQKLKIFTVKNQIVQLQDGISFLIDKIQRYSRAGVIETLIQNQFTGFHGVFHKSQRQVEQFEKLKYEIITEFMQQKIKATPQSQQFLYMKCIMIQNQFFRLAMQSYLSQGFKKLKITDRKYQQLGTFDNFDDISAERAVFQLLEQHMKAEKNLKEAAQKTKNNYKHKPEKYDDPLYRQKKYARIQQQILQTKLLLRGYVKRHPKHSNDEIQRHNNLKLFRNESQAELENVFQASDLQKSSRNVNLNLMPFLVVNKVEFIPLQFNMILTAAQRKNFLDTVIPILWIKDRGIQRFQYKIAKRVIITNAKIINFMEKLNNIASLYKKHDGLRKPLFMRTMIKEFHKFQEKKGRPLGKMYVAYCQGCQGDFTAYNLQQLLRVTKCSRCKYLEGGN